MDATIKKVACNFRKTITSVSNQIYGLKLENVTSSLKVWNVTDPTNVTNHELYFDTPNTATFGYDMSIGLSDEKFIAFIGTEYKTPNLIGYVPNQDLHGDTDVKMIIVAHPNFLSSAQTLADFHICLHIPTFSDIFLHIPAYSNIPELDVLIMYIDFISISVNAPVHP